MEVIMGLLNFTDSPIWVGEFGVPVWNPTQPRWDRSLDDQHPVIEEVGTLQGIPILHLWNERPRGFLFEEMTRGVGEDDIILTDSKWVCQELRARGYAAYRLVGPLGENRWMGVEA